MVDIREHQAFLKLNNRFLIKMMVFLKKLIKVEAEEVEDQEKDKIKEKAELKNKSLNLSSKFLNQKKYTNPLRRNLVNIKTTEKEEEERKSR